MLNTDDQRFDKLPGKSIRVAACILRRTDFRTMKCLIENEQLAQAAGILRSSLRRAIGQLEESDLLEVERFGTARMYHWKSGAIVQVAHTRRLPHNVLEEQLC